MNSNNLPFQITYELNQTPFYVIILMEFKDTSHFNLSSILHKHNLYNHKDINLHPYFLRQILFYQYL